MTASCDLPYHLGASSCCPGFVNKQPVPAAESALGVRSDDEKIHHKAILMHAIVRVVIWREAGKPWSDGGGIRTSASGALPPSAAAAVQKQHDRCCRLYISTIAAAVCSSSRPASARYPAAAVQHQHDRQLLPSSISTIASCCRPATARSPAAAVQHQHDCCCLLHISRIAAAVCRTAAAASLQRLPSRAACGTLRTRPHLMALLCGRASILGASAAPLTLRRVCTRPCVDACLATLNLRQGASHTTIKARFYELAKQTHPDANPTHDRAHADAQLAHDPGHVGAHADGQGAHERGHVGTHTACGDLPSFVEVLHAFEALMEAESGQGGGATAPNDAHRGGTGVRPQRAAHGGWSVRYKTLSEVLCDRLEDEPGAVSEVWREIKGQRLRVGERVLDSLFKACAQSGVGLRGGLGMVREATAEGMLSQQMRAAALVSLIKWCKEDRASFELIINEMDEAERTPEALDTMSYANFLYSGVDGYSK